MNKTKLLKQFKLSIDIKEKRRKMMLQRKFNKNGIKEITNLLLKHVEKLKKQKEKEKREKKKKLLNIFKINGKINKLKERKRLKSMKILKKMTLK
jgi:hypothetical protein